VITSIFDQFEENVRYFPALLSVCDDEDPVEVLARGDIPRLAELRMHNGTIYRWSRSVLQARPGPHAGAAAATVSCRGWPGLGGDRRAPRSALNGIDSVRSNLVERCATQPQSLATVARGRNVEACIGQTRRQQLDNVRVVFDDEQSRLGLPFCGHVPLDLSSRHSYSLGASAARFPAAAWELPGNNSHSTRAP
jgi:hypothetical protein